MCQHRSPCPAATAPDAEAAHLVAGYPEQGWSLLCNGVVLFEDTGELSPNGQVIAPHRPIGGTTLSLGPDAPSTRPTTP
ncbi:DUF5999 family protein [Streptomyces pinistramenti]|uniref:DUF5999 family protein n=1 Tax=Streptomyces pinistramenti TaxID=2884812 RepID=UPI001D06D6BE|nr:DUF5999 family protein [Streptomyces pinistramenti]MCB5911057.1 DUF5999 family protein [Streptomyces pinistramenti]